MAYLRHRHPRHEAISRMRLLRMTYLADWKSAIERGRQITGLDELVVWKLDRFGRSLRESASRR